jgi:hypothetical protein
VLTNATYYYHFGRMVLLTGCSSEVEKDLVLCCVVVHEKLRAATVSNTSNSLIQSRLPPGPKGTILGGNIRQLRAGPLEFFLSTARKAPLRASGSVQNVSSWRATPILSNRCS